MQRCAAKSIYQHSKLSIFSWFQLIQNRNDRSHSQNICINCRFFLRSHFPADSYAIFHFFFRNLQNRLTVNRSCAGRKSNPYRFHTINRFLSKSFYLRKFQSPLRCCTCNFMYQDKAGSTASARSIHTFICCHILIHYDILHINSVFLRKKRCIVKIFQKFLPIFQNHQNPFIAFYFTQCTINLNIRGRLKHIAAYCRIQHPSPYKSHIRRLMTTAACSYQNHFIFIPGLSFDHPTFRHPVQFRMCHHHPRTHFSHQISGIIHNFLHNTLHFIRN